MAVYVIECAGLLKIGFSENPERRVANLFQSASRYSAPRAAHEARGTQRLVCVITDGTKSDEAVIHQALAMYSIGCEWFANEPAVLEYVQSFTAGDYPPVEPIERPGGWAIDAIPVAERGGGNAELVMSVFAKRRNRAA